MDSTVLLNLDGAARLLREATAKLDLPGWSNEKLAVQRLEWEVEHLAAEIRGKLIPE